MAQYNHLPIFQQAYKMTLEIFRATDQFPRAYKYSLGQELKQNATHFLDLVVAANTKTRKLETLEDARILLERVRIHLRLACDLKILGLKHFEALNRAIEDISKQLSGWTEWAKKAE
jgi:hypothetical protein